MFSLKIYIYLYVCNVLHSRFFPHYSEKENTFLQYWNIKYKTKMKIDKITIIILVNKYAWFLSYHFNVYIKRNRNCFSFLWILLRK